MSAPNRRLFSFTLALRPGETSRLQKLNHGLAFVKEAALHSDQSRDQIIHTLCGNIRRAALQLAL